MKVLILAAGYATRLYPLTLDKTKVLLPIKGRPMIEHITTKLEGINELKEIYIITNQKFFPQIQDWSKTVNISKKVEIISDGTTSQEDRIGAIGDINFFIKQVNLNEDLVVIGGDNYFEAPLDKFIRSARRHGTFNSIGVFDFPDKKLLKNYGVLSVDTEGKIIDFQEKPANPISSLISTCIYYFAKEKLTFFDEYIKQNQSPDAPGNYIRWLYKKDKVFTFIFEGNWYDIGDVATYEKLK